MESHRENLSSQPKLAGLDSAIAWLSDRNVSTSLLANVFKTNQTHIRQLVFRGRHGRQNEIISPWLLAPIKPPSDPFISPDIQFKERIGIRTDEDTVALDSAGRRRLSDLEEKIDNLGTDFWAGVPFGKGIEALRMLRQEIGFVGHLPRLRVRARLEHLIAETQLHFGRSISALNLGLVALHLRRAAWAASQDPADLKEFARTTLLLSHAYLLRQESEQARPYLLLYKDASTRAGAKLGAEFFRQQAAASFQDEAWEAARRDFQNASRILADTVEYGRQKQRFEVVTIGERQISLLPKVNWEGALETLAYIEANVPAGSIHRSMNLNWTVACGFATDDSHAHIRAQELLTENAHLSVGFGHQATILRLLAITPELPTNLRADWVRHALYENAFRNS